RFLHSFPTRRSSDLSSRHLFGRTNGKGTAGERHKRGDKARGSARAAHIHLARAYGKFSSAPLYGDVGAAHRYGYAKALKAVYEGEAVVGEPGAVQHGRALRQRRYEQGARGERFGAGHAYLGRSVFYPATD